MPNNLTEIPLIFIVSPSITLASPEIVFSSFARDIVVKIIDKLNNNDIYPRRYFYPSVNVFKNIVSSGPRKVSENIDDHILCIPLYYDLTIDIMDKIIDIIKKEI